MTIGAVFGPINTTTRNAQYDSDSATNSGGESVVVWTDTYGDGSPGHPYDLDIRAQRYNSFGSRLGTEIVVAYTPLLEYSPSVAISDTGQFVVSYTQAVGNDTNVLAQRFDANGNLVGSPIQVGAGTFAESDSDVAMDRYGDFVVSYTRNTNNNNPDIFAKQYNAAGQLLNVINVAISGVAETHSSVAMTPDGRFDVAWEQAYSATDHDIFARRYSASGGLLGTDIVAISTAMDQTPDIAMDNAGDAVVAWDKNADIKARRIDSSGVMGPEINIASTANYERAPSVALKPGGGGFVVVYTSYPTDFHTYDGFVAEVSASNVVTTHPIFGEADSVSIDAFGDYLVTFMTGGGISPQSVTDVFGQRGYMPF
jgi:hypothetical protein